MHAFHGKDPRRNPGLILGHEFCGEIVEGAHKGQKFLGNLSWAYTQNWIFSGLLKIHKLKNEASELSVTRFGMSVGYSF